MAVHIIAVPFDSASHSAGMGCGPTHLLGLGADRALRALGHAVSVHQVVQNSRSAGCVGEIASGFALQTDISTRVREAIVTGGLPMILAGNCICALGAVAGAGAHDLGVLWLDAHGDFHTPETTTSGLVDGMALSIVTGRCWSALASAVPGFHPVPERRVVHLGGRAFDGAERAALGASAFTLVGAGAVHRRGVRETLAPIFDGLGRQTSRLYIHVDMDVVDPGEGVANQFAAPGGLTAADVEECIALAAERFSIVAATIAAYDPTFDAAGDVARNAFRFMMSLSEVARA
ncbi:MAG: arginase family protein [Gemmatimonadaceae bacterium]